MTEKNDLYGLNFSKAPWDKPKKQFGMGDYVVPPYSGGGSQGLDFLSSNPLSNNYSTQANYGLSGLGDAGRFNVPASDYSLTGNSGNRLGLMFGDRSGLKGIGLTDNKSSGLEFGDIFNMPNAKMAFDVLGSLGALSAGRKQMGLARDQFNFNKQLATTNLANQTQAYNNSLEDRLRSRAEFAGDRSEAWKDDFEAKKAKS